MFHSGCSSKYTPHGMDLRELQRMHAQTVTLPYRQGRNYGRIPQSAGRQDNNQPEK